MSRILPILFNTDMVRAILDGRKTVTRRIIKPQMEDVVEIGDVDPLGYLFYRTADKYLDGYRNKKSPFVVGDILYVRETFFREDCTPDCAGRNDEDECPFNRVGDSCYGYKTQYIDSTGRIKWKPSIHMPKEAVRIWLKVTAVRAERLQDITEEQARAEGCIDYHDKTGNGKFDDVLEFDLTARDAFVDLWNSTLKKDSEHTWAHNPWVWVIEFERCEKPD